MKCEYCENEFLKIKINQRFCCEKCRARASSKRCGKKWEKKRRDSLIDSMVKKAIYIVSKGRIKYDQITPEMIVDKRERIIEYRKNVAYKRANPPMPKDTKRSCIICGVEFESVMPNAKYCSEKCSMPIHLEKLRVKWWKGRGKKKPFECKECGKVVIPKYETGNSKRKEYCSDICSNKYSKRVYGNNHTHRARHFGCECEAVNPIRVFMRDGWRCQLCGEKLKRKDRGSIKNCAPELDHIIPLSKGGEHSYRNTQCVCRKCNGEKGNIERGQQRLFG